MALSPKEVKERNDVRVNNACKELETYIDKYLERSPVLALSHIVISLIEFISIDGNLLTPEIKNFPPEIKDIIYDRILKLYTLNGWEASLKRDKMTDYVSLDLIPLKEK